MPIPTNLSPTHDAHVEIPVALSFAQLPTVMYIIPFPPPFSSGTKRRGPVATILPRFPCTEFLQTFYYYYYYYSLLPSNPT